MNSETVRAALDMLELGRPFAWLTIVEQTGSSPRHAGSSMLVRADGSIAGTIGGGALEAAAMQAAADVIARSESVLMDYNLTDDESAALGMICGGHGSVLVDYIDPNDAATRDYFKGLHDLIGSGGRGWMAITVPQTRDRRWRAKKCLVTADGQVKGEPGIPLVELHDLVKDTLACEHGVASARGTTYIKPVDVRSTAYIFGAGHCGASLAPLLHSVGFHTTVIDDRAEFANVTRFPSADRIIVPDSFEGIVEQLPIDDNSYIVIVTRGHLHDRAILRESLGTPAAYVGMIGSKRKVAETFRALEESGIPPEVIARVHAPIGLSIGAETPEEIAVSIAAQLIQVRASKRR